MRATTIQHFEVNITTSTVMCGELLIVADSLYVARWQCLIVALFNIQVPVSRAGRHESATHTLLFQSSVSQAHSAKMRGADITHIDSLQLCFAVPEDFARVCWNPTSKLKYEHWNKQLFTRI